MRTLKLTLAYDGTEYEGWQYQPDKPTVQGTLERAWHAVSGESLRITASGRTDAGVHALGQVASFRTESRLATDVIARAMNAELPQDIAVLAVEEMPPGFHAIRDAVRKRYRYTIHNAPVRDPFRRRYAWHVYRPLDVEAMQRAAEPLRGTHDFRSFESQWPNRATSVRTVYVLDVRRGAENERDSVHFDIEADGFLYNMVRSIVGTLVEVGRGAQAESWPAEVLAALDRRVAGKTAPPQGLFLVRVDYA